MVPQNPERKSKRRRKNKMADNFVANLPCQNKMADDFVANLPSLKVHVRLSRLPAAVEETLIMKQVSVYYCYVMFIIAM